ncbi:MAG: hypothetical protein AB8B67_01025 [Rickettsiaceae bacterium]
MKKHYTQFYFRFKCIMIFVIILCIKLPISNADNLGDTSTTDNDNTGETPHVQHQNKLDSHTQQIMSEYQAYVNSISPELRNEIIQYRHAIDVLNKEKIILYKRLSQQAQSYLKKTQYYKDQLPLTCKGLQKIIDALGDKYYKTTNNDDHTESSLP